MEETCSSPSERSGSISLLDWPCVGLGNISPSQLGSFLFPHHSVFFFFSKKLIYSFFRLSSSFLILYYYSRSITNALNFENPISR